MQMGYEHVPGQFESVKIKNQKPEEIEEQLVEAAAQQIDKKDCSQISDFLKKDYSITNAR